MRISQIIAGSEGTVCHADDVLVYGKDRRTCQKTKSEVLQKFVKAGLTVNEKCEFAVEKGKFLGHKSVHRGSKLIKGNCKQAEPKNVEVRCFRSQINLYVDSYVISL